MIASMFVLTLASVGLISQAQGHSGHRERRPRGDRPMDGARVRDMRDGGMYDDDAGAYGDMDMGMVMDVGMDCSRTLVEVAGLTDAVDDISLELTFLAPNNDAFAAIPADTLKALLATPEELTLILFLHVIEGAVFAGDLVDGMVVPTLNGGDLVVGVTDAGVTFTSAAGVVATVVKADIAVCKSVVHIIDSVLLP
eukprot:jgi/Ulvmu1/869/UM100_0021.1